MKQDSSTMSWNNLGNEWLELAQTGESRMVFIMPYMLELMGDVSGLKILDLGCGEGGYSRELAKRGAEITCVDCNKKAIEYVSEQAKREGLSMRCLLRNSNDLYEIEDGTFDAVLCSMMLMDCADLEGTVKEAARVLKSSGKLYVSVLHPCFNGNYEKGIGRQGAGIDREVVVKNYFEPTEWEAPLYKGSIPVLWHRRTLEEYVRTFIKCGLTIIDLREPRSTDEQAKISVPLAHLQKIPLYLYWVMRK